MFPPKAWQARVVSTPECQPPPQDVEFKTPLLTFDDGPTPGTTDRILDLLAEHGVSAAFFVCGANAEKHPAIVSRAANEGHFVGNHSWNHPLLTTLADEEVERQLRDTNGIIESITGQCPRLFRPPYGAASEAVLETARSLQLQTMMWTYSPDDWQCPGADVIERRVIEHLGDDSIILLHDGCADELSSSGPSFEGLNPSREQTVEALPGILAAISRL